MSPAERGRVIITRSEPGATLAATAFRAAGITAEVRPVVGIEPLAVDPDALSVAGRADGLVFTSVHAVTIGVPLFAGPHAAVAVGAATGQALRDRGWLASWPAVAGSEGLLAMPALSAQAVRHRNWCVVKGSEGRMTLVDTLQARGATVTELLVYRRQPRSPAPVGWRVGDVVLLGSGEAITALQSSDQWADWRSHPWIVPSARVAGLARSAGAEKVLVAGPDVLSQRLALEKLWSAE